jgi:hypothetical protein
MRQAGAIWPQAPVTAGGYLDDAVAAGASKYMGFSPRCLPFFPLMQTRPYGYPRTGAEVEAYRADERRRRQLDRRAEDKRQAAWASWFDALPAATREALESRAAVRLARFLKNAPPEEHATMIRHQAIALLAERETPP